MRLFVLISGSLSVQGQTSMHFGASPRLTKSTTFRHSLEVMSFYETTTSYTIRIWAF